MTKRKHRALMWVGAILGVMSVATVIFVATLDWNKAKKYIVAGVSKATGRQLRPRKPISVTVCHYGLSPGSDEEDLPTALSSS
jgi:uncharacterized protein involved in outer membrane biogenesis